MTDYVDSGVLVKLYVREPNSVAAARAVGPLMSVALSALHELEIRNAFRALEGRGTITAAQRAASEHVLETDIAAERLRRVGVDWAAVFARAERLSQGYTANTLARSLDILHVAIALSTNCTRFITADARQHRLAQSAGLQAELID